mgnify:CR=1 FL=1
MRSMPLIIGKEKTGNSSAGRGAAVCRKGVTMDWREILKTNVTHAGELEDIMHLHGEHEQEVERILERFPMSVPRY